MSDASLVVVGADGRVAPRNSPPSEEDRPIGPLAALSVRNFRHFAIGQGISLIGSWTETVAQAILVLQLTNSATAVGFATAARYLPVLLLTPYAGLLVDRMSKRRLLVATASLLASLSLLQAGLVLTHRIDMTVVFVVALLFGCLSALDNPARQAFIPEMVGKPLIRNAVTINSTMVNVGRAVGPLVAALLITTVGIGWCFLVNAISFAAVLAALLAMQRSALHPVQRVTPAPGQLLEGFRYALTVPEILGPVAMMALIGTFTYEFEVSLPLFAKVSLAGGAASYSWLLGAFGAGSVVGGIYCMLRPELGLPRLVRAASLYGAAMLATACAPTQTIAVVLLFVVGLASITFITTGNATIQLAAAPQYRGRVTALWSTAFVGSTPIGASIIGLIDSIDPRWGLGVGGIACLVAVLVGRAAARAHQ
ncbi:MFS family permease [Sphingomonas sp. BE270]|uniref:MFS transporter n=1 Tax=unclassified Sphingomonas TaxID=196159 RepID=UPI001484CBF7|nr:MULTISPECIES: MFS transporter [unclassified Sphingomonas]MDR7258624.1 MFS family permease [Sphingomonas sp. BE270]